jgi:hypothetical protein
MSSASHSDERRQEGRACAQVGIQLAEVVLQRELCVQNCRLIEESRF